MLLWLIAPQKYMLIRVAQAPLIVTLMSASQPSVASIPELKPALIEPTSVAIAPPEFVVIEEPNDNAPPMARYAAPQWLSSATSDIGALARDAGLADGTVATVVLRVQVLPTGSPGQIFVDVGSGDARVDVVAVAYAQTQRWLPGMINGVAAAMQIRWAVHVSV